MTQERLIVIGGNAAGMSAASTARRGREDMKITVFEKGPHTSYAPWGIPYYVGGVVDDEESLIERTPEAFREKQDIDVLVHHSVLSIDPDKQKVLVRDGQKGKETRESYDQLMIAVGAEPIRPPLDGIEAEGIYGVATLESGMEVARFIDGQKPGRAVIIGGGYIGLEMAEALVLREMEVSLVEAGPEVMGTLDPDMGRLVSEALMDIGVTLYREERVEGFEKKGNRVRAVNTDERTLPADLVILGMGVQPSVSLAEDAGIPLGESGAIRVNTRMQTDSENIWAGGDCAESFHIVSRRPMHIALGTVANRHGRTAGINIGGGYAAFRGIVGTAVSKVCSLEVARTGLQEKEIQALGLEHVSSRIESTTRAGYYPDAGPMTVKVLAEKGSGRLLGGQIVGKEGSAKRIDILATAIHAGMAVDEVANLDLGYAPPFSPLWDPVIIGARITTKEL